MLPNYLTVEFFNNRWICSLTSGSIRQWSTELLLLLQLKYVGGSSASSANPPLFCRREWRQCTLPVNDLPGLGSHLTGKAGKFDSPCSLMEPFSSSDT